MDLGQEQTPEGMDRGFFYIFIIYQLVLMQQSIDLDLCI